MPNNRKTEWLPSDVPKCVMYMTELVNEDGLNTYRLFLDRLATEPAPPGKNTGYRLEAYYAMFHKAFARSKNDAEGHRLALTYAQERFGYEPKQEVKWWQQRRRVFWEQVKEAVKQSEKDARASGATVDALPKADAECLPADVLWVYNHLHQMPDFNKPDTWKVGPADAPNRGAWNMLTVAASSHANRTAFIKGVIARMNDAKKKSDSDADTDALSAKELKDIEAINDLLDEALG